MESGRFVGAALVASKTYVHSSALSQGEPPLPSIFYWRKAELPVIEVVRAWRTTRTDRGDDYLAKHWYEISTASDRHAIIYFDRKARAGRPRWWLYSITD